MRVGASGLDAHARRQHAKAQLDRIVIELLLDARAPACIPVELPTIARYLGCSEIRTRPLGLHHARTEVSREGIVITLNVDQSFTRQRFALAHEIGHLLLAHPRYEFLAAVRRDAGLTDSERFCNDFAGRLLLPAAWLVWLRRHPVAIQGLCEHAAAAQVSLAAALLRLRETRRWTFSMLQWRRSYGSWEFAARIAVPRRTAVHRHRRDASGSTGRARKPGRAPPSGLAHARTGAWARTCTSPSAPSRQPDDCPR